MNDDTVGVSAPYNTVADHALKMVTAVGDTPANETLMASGMIIARLMNPGVPSVEIEIKYIQDLIEWTVAYFGAEVH